MMIGAAYAIPCNGYKTIPDTTGPIPSSWMAQVKYANFAVAGAGNNTIVPSVVGKKIRVLYFKITAVLAVNFCVLSGTTVTGIAYGNTTTRTVLGAVGASLQDGCDDGLFETVAGEALTLNLSAALGVTGFVVYIEV
jgi:hypothetical protein